MHSLTKLALKALLLISPATCNSNPKPPGKDAILLSNVQTLTLRAHRMTSSRRVSPIPQISCAGPSKQICNLYQPEVMRCTNQGYDYDVEDVQWTCTADLPAEFKLGATDVICEGYRNADDKWVLKGSCGVEYRLLLSEAGEKRFGKKPGDSEWDWAGKGRSGTGVQKMMAVLGDLIFFGFIAAVFVMIFWPILAQCFGWGNRRARRPGPAPGWGGFWGGGGGGGGGGDGNDPPPPYSSFDPYKSAGRQQGWTPGFWTGTLGGAAAGYHMGRRSGNGSRGTMPMGRSGRYDPGEGSSSSPPQFSSSTASTGFGSTRRR
ncbi:Protein of unknown function DUF1183 TMEM66 [Penicillium cf. griseofulvum]|uniref:Store-operated calcium entry-associated regulatory factor n=1 Tax=Penicillium cf. griseofulvum TaxID=2972120 RepID=A0A9W9MQC0_9EURO|nr:Protein of unknown function DUF1183 TMEM66 [Penicillium cf. griseofulvum]KAJ5437335.1 Protein of unknown function DUF1183 TMEM66 [Penicillium cf. griseofulvum]KAJ5441482.1 Protein of unknown function DUF1183 TMEM66 [Penicillium cf. griseofulvum]